MKARGPGPVLKEPAPGPTGWGPSIGIDIVDASRVSALARNERFLKRVFTEREITYCLRGKAPYKPLAGRLAAKEACLKALSTMAGVLPGAVSGVKWTDMEVIKPDKGRPRLLLHGRAGEILGERRAHLSMSCSGPAAIAFVAIE